MENHWSSANRCNGVRLCHEERTQPPCTQTYSHRNTEWNVSIQKVSLMALVFYLASSVFVWGGGQRVCLPPFVENVRTTSVRVEGIGLDMYY